MGPTFLLPSPPASGGEGVFWTLSLPPKRGRGEEAVGLMEYYGRGGPEGERPSGSLTGSRFSESAISLSPSFYLEQERGDAALPTSPENGTMDDAALVRQVLAGQSNAYAQLVQRWAGRVLALCHSRLGRADLAEE